MARSGWKGRRQRQEGEQRQQALAERRKRARQQLIKRVEELSIDPRFQVLTFDKLNWINPYSGQIVSMPFDSDRAIRDYLLQHQPWQSGKEPLPLLKLTQIVWIHYLMRNIISEDYLHIFKGDNWLNPFTGQWISDVPLDAEGKPDSKTITFLSKILNGDPRCAQLQMIDRRELDRLAAAMPNQQAVEVAEHVDLYDGLIEDDESLYLDFNLMEKDGESYTPRSNPVVASAPPPNDEHTRLIQRINAANKRIPEAPLADVPQNTGSSQQLRSVLLPDLPNIRMSTRRVHGKEHYRDFTYAATMGSGQTLIIHGNLSLPQSEERAPYRDIESMLRRICQVESKLDGILQSLHLQLGQHFQYMLGLDCFALVIDTLDMHIELAVAGFDHALAARPGDGSLLNLIGDPVSTLGLSDESLGAVEYLSLELEADDVLLFYTHGLAADPAGEAELCAAFVRAMIGRDEPDVDGLMEQMSSQLEGGERIGGTLFALQALEVSDDLSLIQ